MQRLTLQLKGIEEFMMYDISLIMEDEAPEKTAMDLVPKNEVNRMKILCMQLANGNIREFNRLYEDTNLKEVYEMMTLQNAINYRFEEVKE